MKKKLDIDFECYIILGAGNPSFAKKFLDCDRSIGLLSPCNIVVQEQKMVQPKYQHLIQKRYLS